MTALLLAFASPVAADGDPIYRSTAPDGTPVFSDRPSPGSTVVRAAPLNVLPADTASAEGNGETAVGDRRGSAAPGSPTPEGIERVVIVSPPPDATLFDPEGPLVVALDTAPGPLEASGLRAELLLDGEVVRSGRTPTLSVPAPERGTHEIRARLVDAAGNVVAVTEGQSLHVRRHTVGDALGGSLLPRPPRTDEEQ